MRLAYICPEMLPLPAVKGGGIEALIDGVTPIIAGRHDLTVISITDSKLPNSNVFQGARYVRFSPRSYRASVIRYLQQERPFDVVHVFNRPRNVHLYKQASPTSRFVVSLHNEMFRRSMLPEEEGKQCINSVDKIITVSNYIGRTVTRRFPGAQGKVQTVYSGVDLDRFPPVWTVKEKRREMRGELGLAGKTVFVFTGRLKPKKGAHILIEAFKQLLSGHPDIRLMIIGSRWFSDNTVDEYVQKLHNLAEPVKEKIIFTNYVPQKELPDYLIAGNVFVCPSQWQEPLARVHYEAMAAGLPIITTNRGGNSEVVTQGVNGLLITDYKNPSAFMAAMKYILANPRRAVDMGIRGRKLAEERFGFSRVAEDLLRVYENCQG